jgi:Cof subfamily protein (haloacid dehalogenase superfamily)
MYRLLALDLDGTVIGRDRRISEPVRAAVTAAVARGVRVTLATGRGFRTARPFAEQLGLCDPLICYQGALIKHPVTADVLDHTPMPGPLAAEAVAMLHGPAICVIAFIDEKLGIVEDGDQFARFVGRWGSPDRVHLLVAPDLVEVVRVTPPTKVMFFGDPPRVDAEIARAIDRFGARLTVVRSDPTIGELTAPGLNKGLALAKLAHHLGVERADVLAIGDEDNDVPMLEWAGLGLAMGNAPPSVQRAARAVIPPVDDDGVAWAIGRYVLSSSARGSATR